MKVRELKKFLKNIDDDIEVTATADLLRNTSEEDVEEISLDFKVETANLCYYCGREVLDLGLDEVK